MQLTQILVALQTLKLLHLLILENVHDSRVTLGMNCSTFIHNKTTSPPSVTIKSLSLWTDTAYH